MKNLMAKIKSHMRIKKAKKHIEEMFKAFRHFDNILSQHYKKSYYYSHFESLFPEMGTFKQFYENICGALQIIFEYMDITRPDWANIVEVHNGNFIYDGKSVRFMIETSKFEDYDHDTFITIKNIKSDIDMNISIKYGGDEMDGLQDCPIIGFEGKMFRHIGCMIADALASIYIEERSRREKVK